MANKIIQIKDGSDNLYPCGSIVAGTSGFFTAASGITIRAMDYKRVGHLLQLKIIANKGGNAFSNNARTQLGTLSAGFCPNATVTFIVGASNGIGSYVNRYAGLVITSAGVVNADIFGASDVKEVFVFLSYII